MKKVVLLLLLCPLCAYSAIKKIQIFGERCSGTNYMEKLLQANCKEINKNYFFYGHKHFPCWFKHPFDKAFYPLPEQNFTLKNNMNTLFIVIFRNPYDWLRSLRNTPHHAAKSLWNKPFSQFIRAKWITNPRQLGENARLELDPATRLPFKNVMKLRTARIVNMLKIKDLVHNYYMVNYETLYKNPKRVLEEISERFSVKMQQKFIPVLEHFNGDSVIRKKYSHTNYPEISDEDLAYINEQLDWRVEKKIGYKKK